MHSVRVSFALSSAPSCDLAVAERTKEQTECEQHVANNTQKQESVCVANEQSRAEELHRNKINSELTIFCCMSGVERPGFGTKDDCKHNYKIQPVV